MNKYIVRFFTSSGDIATEWVEADSEEKALDAIEDKYSNITKILSVTEV